MLFITFFIYLQKKLNHIGANIIKFCNKNIYNFRYLYLMVNRDNYYHRQTILKIDFQIGFCI